MLLSRRSFSGGLAAASMTQGKAFAADQKILRVGLSGLPFEKGNAFSNFQTPGILMIGGIFDGLTRMTKQGDVEPWLATSWEALDDVTWRFTLRDGVVFSNSKPFDAAAVAHTVNYLTGDGPQTEGLRRDFRFLDGATVIDDHTVDIKTKAPVPMFPRYAAVLLIVEPGAWQDMGVEQFSLTPVGTGPLVVEGWEPARAMTKRNPLSWRPLNVDGIEFVVVPDNSARLQALLSGGLDVCYQIAPEDFGIIENIGGDIASVKDGAVYSIMLQYGNDRDTPLNDIRVRHALNYAVDKQTIVDALLGGRTVVSSQPTVREAYGYDPSLTPYSYDLERAKSLLIDAGYPDGFDMSLVTSGGGTNAALVVQRVADDLSRIGVRVDVQQRPVMRFLMDFVRGRIEADSFTLQWGSYPIVDSIQTTNINSCRKVMAPWFCDPVIQPTIDAAWVESDQDLALTLRQEVMGYYREQSPSILLYENIAFVGLSSRIQGFDQTFGYISFETIHLN